MRLGSVSNLLQCLVRITATLISAEQLARVVNFFNPIQGPALVFALRDAERTTVTATIERFGFIESGPCTIRTREKPPFQLDSLFLSPAPIALLLLVLAILLVLVLELVLAIA